MKNERLNEIVKLCGKVNRVADIGCDHGKVLGELHKNGASYLIASDISEPSVKKAEQLLKELNCKNYSIRVGDGFSTLTNADNLDLIIIAGMGGYEIVKIINNSKINLKKLILQPQNNVIMLRNFLIEHNFKIITDKVVEDKSKFYNVLKVEKTNIKHHLTKREIEFGKTNLKKFNPSFIKMLEEENFKLANRIEKIKNDLLKKEFTNKIIKNNKEIERAKSRR